MAEKWEELDKLFLQVDRCYKVRDPIELLT